MMKVCIQFFYVLCFQFDRIKLFEEHRPNILKGQIDVGNSLLAKKSLNDCDNFNTNNSESYGCLPIASTIAMGIQWILQY